MIGVVIPHYHDLDRLPTLLNELGSCNLIAQVVVCDDGTPEIDEQVSSISIPKHLDFKLVHNKRKKGAGGARNSGLKHINQPFVWFIDADDNFINVEEFQSAFNNLIKGATTEPDVIVMPYADSRFSSAGEYLTSFSDEMKWQNSSNEDGPISDAFRSDLMQLPNYPWNKICSAKYMKKNKIVFEETIVHNDILFHWLTLLKSDDIHWLDVRTIYHNVDDLYGSRLTQLQSNSRLSAIQTFGKLLEATLEDKDRKRFLPTLMAYFNELIQWIDMRLDQDGQMRLRKELNSVLLNSLNAIEAENSLLKDPENCTELFKLGAVL